MTPLLAPAGGLRRHVRRHGKCLEEDMTDETLETRVASALSDPAVTSAALSALITETEAAISAADQEAE
jgi:hypothetical protein